MKIIQKFSLMFLFMTLLILFVGYFSVRTSKKIMEESIIQSTMQFNSDILDEIDITIQRKIEIFQAYSRDLTIQKAVLESNRKFERSGNIQDRIDREEREWRSAPEETITPFMQTLMENRAAREIREKIIFFEEKYGYPILAEVILTNKYGANIAITGKTTDYRQDDEEWWRKSKEDGLFVKDVEYDESSDVFSIDIGIGIKDKKGNFVGAFKIIYNIDEVINGLKDLSKNTLFKKYKSIKYTLMTDEGKIIYSSGYYKFFEDATSLVPFGHLKDSLSSVDRRSTRQGETFAIHNHSRGYKDFKGLGWSSLVEYDAAEIFAPVTQLKETALITTLLVAFLALVSGLFVSKKIINPIIALKNAAKEIGKGHLEMGTTIASRDEIGELADSFKKMTLDLKKSRDEIVSSKEFSDNILRSMFSALIIVSKEGTIRELNQFALKLLGYTINDLLNQSIDLILRGKAPLQGIWLNNLIKKGFTDNTEGVLVTKDGRNLPALFSGSVLLDNTGEIQGIVFVAKDLSELKKSEEEKMRLEAQLQQVQKLEAIGTLAGGVAHDLNNILAGIVSYPELILMDLPEDSPLRKPVSTIMESGQKAAVIVNDLLTLARRGVKISDVVNLNNIVSDYLHGPEYGSLRELHPGMELETNLDPNLFNISGSPVHLFKTVMNLVTNSTEAITGIGKIQISTSNQYVDRPIKGYEDVQEGDYVVLSVSDSGMGISRKDLSRIFEPFYSKKVMGRSGTGLGMAVVWGTVKDHKGYIDIQSAIGEGTRCDLYFPVTRQERIDKKTADPLEEYMGNETILVIDDIQEQREIAHQILNRWGYSVTTLPSGEEAIEYMQKNSADLLILDMIMDPGIDGLDTYKRILELHPGQKAIIASGFSETARVKEARKLGTSAYLKKPYSLHEIGMAVRAVLDR